MNTVKKEKLEELCIRYLDCLDVSLAAKRAGLEGDPLVTGTRLLSTRSARRILKRLTDADAAYTLAMAGLIKLALGNRSDAVKLAGNEMPKSVSSLDLYGVTDIKRGKDGGGEVKLINRLDALEKLLELSDRNDGSQSAMSFFSALNGVCSVSDSDTDE